MGFTFTNHSISTDRTVDTEIRDYGDTTYPVRVTLSVQNPEGYQLISLSFYTREAAQHTLADLVGKANGWLADEWGLHRGLPAPEEVWPEAEQETIEEQRAQAAYEALRSELEPDGRGG